MTIFRSEKSLGPCIEETGRTYTEILKNTRHLTAYKTEDGTTLIMSQEGPPLTRKEFYNLFRSAHRWYESHTDQEIQDIYDDISENHHSDQLRNASKENPPRPGVVYLMKSGEYYKIGETSNLPVRQKSFGLQLPHPFEIVHTIASNDPRSLEDSLHSQFSAKRMNGEWFNLTEADCAAICAMTGDR